MQLPITGHLGVNLMQLKSEVERRTESAIEARSSTILGWPRITRLCAVASGAVEMAGITSQQLEGNVRPLASSSSRWETARRTWQGLPLRGTAVLARSSAENLCALPTFRLIKRTASLTLPALWRPGYWVRAGT